MEEDTRVEIEVICGHYFARSDCEPYWGRLGDGVQSMWDCPVCRGRCFNVDRRGGFAGCLNDNCEVPEGLTPSQVVAALGDFDARTQKREINRERKTILNEDELARRREAESRRIRDEGLDELRQHEASEARRERDARRNEALRGWESRHTLSEREAVVQELAHRARERTPERVAERREEADARTHRHLCRLLRGESTITGKEAVICLLLMIGTLTGVLYLVSFFQALNPSFLPGRLVACRLPIGLACGCLVAYVSWRDRSGERHRSVGLRGSEHVGIYVWDKEWRIQWHDRDGA